MSSHISSLVSPEKIFICMKITYKKGKLIIPIEEGDTMLVGRFKNKSVKVKKIEFDEIGQPLVNGSPILKCKLPKTM